MATTESIVDETLIEREVFRCNNCGNCRAVCPILREEGIESASPRGKINLARALNDGRLHSTSRLEELVYKCLGCKACTVTCPSGVRTDEVVYNVRVRLSAEMRQPLVKKLVLKNLLSSPGNVELAGFLVRFYQRSGLEVATEALGILNVLPRNLRRAHSLMPSLRRAPLRSRLPEVTPARGKKLYRVGYFLGCAQNLIFPRTGAATVALLAANGCEVVTPRETRCCGSPHRAYGEHKEAVTLAQHNLRLFRSLHLDAIVTDCATCGSALKGYSELLGGAKQGEFRVPIYDISQFLLENADFDNPLVETPQTVTYHDPCHLARAQKVVQPPRALLQKVPGLKLVEMRESDWCCGGAGSFNLTRYELSMKILSRKIANITATSAELVATGCPGCQVQIGYGLRQSASKATVVHPVDLLGRAFLPEMAAKKLPAKGARAR